MAKWECVGPVRGRCGVKHRSVEAARLHCQQDQRRVASLGGGAYRDRRAVADGGQSTVDGLI